MTDEITLTVPRDRDFYRVAHLVVGGLALRLDLTYESLEDIQLALQGVLDRPDGEGDITVSVRVEGDSLRARVGPFFGDSLRRELSEQTASQSLSLRRLLDAVVDNVELGQREGGDWIELTKRVQLAGEPA